MEERIIHDERCLNRKDSRLEAKPARTGIPQFLWGFHSAFANTSGGTIVPGPDEPENGGISR